MEGLLHFIVAKIILLALLSSFVSCYDPSPLQDYCVGTDDINGVSVNGDFCKNPRLVTPDDFYYSGLNIPRNTSNRLGSRITSVNANTLPSLNTLGVSLARIDFRPGGQVPPHIHPRGSELMVVLKGMLYVGFVSSDQDDNRLFSKILYPGDAFVFPIGMIHFHVNIGKTNAVTISAGGSKNPGFIVVGNSVYGSNPRIDPKLLAIAFAMNVSMVRRLQEEFPFEDIRR